MDPMWNSKILVLVFLFFSGCTQGVRADENTLGSDRLYITAIHPRGSYTVKDVLIESIDMANETSRQMQVEMKIELLNQQEEVLGSFSEILEINKGEYLNKRLEFQLNEEIPTGRYRLKVSAYGMDSKQTDRDDNKLLIYENVSIEEIVVFRHVEDFDRLDDSIWEVSEKKLGISHLKKSNVQIKEKMLTITLPKGQLEGGEIVMKEGGDYGIYEARMKLPKEPSSITGFFMYAPPDFYYEIDMEIINDSAGRLLLTTYAGGERSNSSEVELGFDPTQAFHDYRFEYDESKLIYYVDGNEVGRFTKKLPKGKMQLMLNCWYPKWMGGETEDEDQSLSVDWIRY